MRTLLFSLALIGALLPAPVVSAQQKVTVSVGPLTAGVTGVVALQETGLRLDATFKTVPIACERLAREEAKRIGPLTATLQALGQSTGALKVTGMFNALGVLKYDTAEPDRTTVSWLAKETCGVSLFGL